MSDQHTRESDHGKDGKSVIRVDKDGNPIKIIESGKGTEQIHVHRHPGGLTISRYDKSTGKVVRDKDGNPERFTFEN